MTCRTTPRHAQGERLFGANAEGIVARKPRHVYVAPQRMLGRNATHPAVVDYTTKSFLALETVANARGGMSIVVPAEESGLSFLRDDASASSASESASTTAAGSSSTSPSPTPASVIAAAGAVPPGRADGFAFATEEVVSMMLAHAREFSQVFSGGPIFDVVLTVPAYATQNERLALVDAAELAGLKVLALVDENTAAGIHYGIDRVFDNVTHVMALYNMGAEATQVRAACAQRVACGVWQTCAATPLTTSASVHCAAYPAPTAPTHTHAQVTLFAYDAYVIPASAPGSGGKNKTVGQARVLAKAWDTALGGRHFDRVLTDYVSAKFNKEKGAKVLPPSAGGDIRALPASMAKVRKAITKAKEVSMMVCTPKMGGCAGLF